MMERLDANRRRRVEERAAELIAEEMTLRELRKARRFTQARVAAELGITQDGVSRLEKPPAGAPAAALVRKRRQALGPLAAQRPLSTLRKTVEAMGGNLSLVARFPDRPPVELLGISEGD